MFSKLAIFIISAAAIVSATPTDPPAGSTTVNTTVNKCNVGTLQCCQSVQKTNDANALKELGLANVGLGSLGALVGVQCNPIDVLVAAGTGSNCNGTPVCCKKNLGSGGLVGQCVPFNANV